MELSIKDLAHLMKNSLVENFIFCAVVWRSTWNHSPWIHFQFAYWFKARRQSKIFLKSSGFFVIILGSFCCWNSQQRKLRQGYGQGYGRTRIWSKVWTVFFYLVVIKFSARRELISVFSISNIFILNIIAWKVSKNTDQKKLRMWTFWIYFTYSDILEIFHAVQRSEFLHLEPSEQWNMRLSRSIVNLVRPLRANLTKW